MKRLKALGNYQNLAKGLQYKAGEIFDVSDVVAMYLKADAPGLFEDYVPEASKPKRARGKNKAVKSPKVDK